MSIKIYFDMDGVLADFDAATKKYSSNNALLNKRGHLLEADLLAAKRERWHKIEQDRTFWTNIPVMQGIDAVLNIAKDCGELFVLTSVPGAKNFNGGVSYVDFIEQEKRVWIEKYLSKYFDADHVIVTRIAKEKLIKPTNTDILIDDRSENVADWLAAGGKGIIYKSPLQTIKDLTSVEDFIKRKKK